MTRRGGDAYNPNNLPPGLDLYFAYTNGINTSMNYSEVRQRFPNATILSISTNGNVTASDDIADCENGDYTPASAALWAHNRIVAGHRPTIYCTRATYPQVATELQKYALAWGRDVDCWLATLDGTQTSSLVGVVAVQWTNHGGLWDETVVYADNWHRTTPVTTPQPTRPPNPLFSWIPKFVGWLRGK